MKKFLGLIVAFLLMVSSIATFIGQGETVNAQAYDSADRYFLEFVASDSTLDGDISFTHNPLYNAQLEPNGREYLFTVGGVSGYALMTEFHSEDRVFYEIEELFYNRTSPFASCVGLPVFIAHNAYLEYKDQAFYDLTSGAVVDGQTVIEIAQNGFNYFGGTTATFTTVYTDVMYSTKSTTQYSIQYDLPSIIGSVEGGSCAHTAGAVILTYYDRFYENIIPNFVPYIMFGSTLIYRDGSAEVNNMTLELVDLMLIGEPHEGTTFSEFQLGMETYVEQQGYTYTSTNLFSNGTFNFNNYKNAVESNKPCAIFLTNFAMLDGMGEIDGGETISSGYCPVSHVVAGCGYKIDTYYDEDNNLIDTRTYLKVASGTLGYGLGYLNINGLSTISKAISILVS